MLAAVFRNYGSVSTALKLEEVPRLEPKADQILVQVCAVALNDYEFDLVQGAPFIISFFGSYPPQAQYSRLRYGGQSRCSRR